MRFDRSVLRGFTGIHVIISLENVSDNSSEGTPIRANAAGAVVADVIILNQVVTADIRLRLIHALGIKFALGATIEAKPRCPPNRVILEHPMMASATTHRSRLGRITLPKTV